MMPKINKIKTDRKKYLIKCYDSICDIMFDTIEDVKTYLEEAYSSREYEDCIIFEVEVIASYDVGYERVFNFRKNNNV